MVVRILLIILFGVVVAQEAGVLRDMVELAEQAEQVEQVEEVIILAQLAGIVLQGVEFAVIVKWVQGEEVATVGQGGKEVMDSQVHQV